jgi:hypothetical protein
MRNQKREFVVEYKTRRRTQVTPKSIWEDIDLKAASRAVEADANLLFKPEEPAGPLVDATHLLESVSAAEPGSSSVSSMKCASPSDGNMSAPIAAVAQTVVQTDGEASPVVRQKPKRQKASKSREQGIDLIGANGSLVSLEELAGLQAENARLKLILRASLVHDNTVLRAMMARFG